MAFLKEPATLSLSLPPEAYYIAEQFGQLHRNARKAKQICLNTLAVYTVNFWLKCLGIETELKSSESWNPIMQALLDVADLEITNIGKLECRLVWGAEEVCYIPPEALPNRIGYLVVQINKSLTEVTLLGFAYALEPNTIPEQILITNLYPLETLIDYLYRLESANNFLHSSDEIAVQLREKLKAGSLSEIAAQLERIYRTYHKREWRYAGGDVLVRFVTIDNISKEKLASVADWELFDEGHLLELQDLAEELIQRFAEIWELTRDKEASIPNSESAILQREQVFTSLEKRLVNLSQWFQNIFEPTWQTVKELFNTEAYNPIFNIRSAEQSIEINANNQASGVSAGKIIDLGMQLEGNPVALVITLTPAEADEEDEEVNIHLRVYPTGKQIYLPPNLQLIVLDESGTTIPELLAQARSADNWIQLEFGAKPKELFSISVTLGDVSITENFVV